MKSLQPVYGYCGKTVDNILFQNETRAANTHEKMSGNTLFVIQQRGQNLMKQWRSQVFCPGFGTIEMKSHKKVSRSAISSRKLNRTQAEK